MNDKSPSQYILIAKNLRLFQIPYILFGMSDGMFVPHEDVKHSEASNNPLYKGSPHA